MAKKKKEKRTTYKIVKGLSVRGFSVEETLEELRRLHKIRTKHIASAKDKPNGLYAHIYQRAGMSMLLEDIKKLEKAQQTVLKMKKAGKTHISLKPGFDIGHQILERYAAMQKLKVNNNNRLSLK